MAQGILVGWKGLSTENGALKYTVEDATAVLKHNPEIRDFVFDFATEQENYRVEEIEETAKKSASS